MRAESAPPHRSSRLLLVRHGESVWNVSRRWQGQADPPLSELGRRQAAHASRSLAQYGVDAVWASDLSRARETADLIGTALRVGPTAIDRGLRERAAGEWSGLSRAEIAARYPGFLDASGPQGAARPKRPRGWEHDDELLIRAIDALSRIRAAAPGRTVLVVTHGGLIGCVEVHLGAARERVANLEGRWLVSDGDMNWVLGQRELLVDERDVALTVPGHV